MRSATKIAAQVLHRKIAWVVFGVATAYCGGSSFEATYNACHHLAKMELDTSGTQTICISVSPTRTITIVNNNNTISFGHRLAKMELGTSGTRGAQYHQQSLSVYDQQ